MFQKLKEVWTKVADYFSRRVKQIALALSGHLKENEANIVDFILLTIWAITGVLLVFLGAPFLGALILLAVWFSLLTTMYMWFVEEAERLNLRILPGLKKGEGETL